MCVECRLLAYVYCALNIYVTVYGSPPWPIQALLCDGGRCRHGKRGTGWWRLSFVVLNLKQIKLNSAAVQSQVHGWFCSATEIVDIFSNSPGRIRFIHSFNLQVKTLKTQTMQLQAGHQGRNFADSCPQENTIHTIRKIL